MIRWIIIKAILFAVVSSNKYHLLDFGRDQRALIRCLEENEFLINLFSHDHETRIHIAYFFATALSRSSKTVEYIEREVDMNIDILSLSGHGELRHNQSYRAEAKKAIERAILDCSDNEIEYDDETRQESNVEELPYLIDEIPEIGFLLDFILVNWSRSLEEMISSRSTRALLRNYTLTALEIIEFAYPNHDHDHFQTLLRQYWMNRARLFFDARDTVHPYIDHRYSEVLGAPHTSGDVSIFPIRGAQNLRVRSPEASRSEIESILSTHVGQPSQNVNDFFYYVYRDLGMTRAEFYFENHVRQFYRLILFFLELQARGIARDEDDYFEGPIPFDRVSENIQAILYNDTVYWDYLNRTRFGLMGVIDVYAQNLARNYRIFEEDLIMALWTRNRRNLLEAIANATTTSTTTTTSATTRATSIKPQYKIMGSKKGKGLKGRGLIAKGPAGKCISDYTVALEGECSKNQNKNFYESTDSTNFTDARQVNDNNTKNRCSFFTDESAFLLKTLSS